MTRLSTALENSPRPRTAPFPRRADSICKSDKRHASVESHVDVAAPVGGWKRVARDGLYVGGSTAIGHALAVVTSLLLRWLLDPAEMGIWQGLKLVLSYANYTNLGTSKAAARDLAIAKGQGDVAAARRSTDLAFSFNTVTSGLYGLLVLAAAGWIAIAGTGPWRWAWCGGLAAVGLLAVLQRHVTFLVTMLRSLQAFAATSQIAILEALLTLAGTALAVWALGMPGLYLTTLLVLVGSLVWLKLSGAPHVAWAWDRDEIRRLLRIGGPMVLVGVLGALFRSLDKLLVLGCFDDREFQLGCYSLAILATTQLTGVASMLSIVMGPRFGELLGGAGDRAAARLAATTIELQALVMTAAGCLMIVAAPPLLARMLPEYQAGLTALVIRTPGIVAFGLTLPIGQYLMAVNQQGRALAALIVAAGIGLIAGVGAAKAGWGLEGIAAGMTIADVVQLVTLVLLSFGSVLDHRALARMTWVTGSIALPTLGLAIAAETIYPCSICDWPVTLLKGLSVTALFAVTAVIVLHRGGWARHWHSEAHTCNSL